MVTERRGVLRVVGVGMGVERRRELVMWPQVTQISEWLWVCGLCSSTRLPGPLYVEKGYSEETHNSSTGTEDRVSHIHLLPSFP